MDTHDESFANFVIPRDQVPTQIHLSSTPLKDNVSPGITQIKDTPQREKPGRLFSQRDSPTADSDSGPNKQSRMDLTKEEEASLVDKGMPPWGFQFLQIMNNRIEHSSKEIKVEIGKVQTDIQSLESRLDTKIDTKCEAVLEECLDKVASVQYDVDHLSEQVSDIQLDIEILQEQQYQDRLMQAKSNMYSRRLHLLFCGFREKRGETSSDCEKLVRDQLAKMKVDKFPNLKTVRFLDCHRNGPYKKDQSEPRDILVKFANIPDKKAVLRGKMSCDPNIFIKQDIPPLIAQIQRQLKPIFKVIQGTPYQEKGRVFLKGDAIIIDKRRFTLDTITKIPSSLPFWDSNVKSNDKCFVWHGNLSPFSNMFRCKVVIGGVTYYYGEQYIHGFKAVKFGDRHTYRKIMASRCPYEMKTLSYDIKGFDQDKWNEVAESVADTVLTAKIKQSNYCRQFLLDTKDLELAEASPKSLWGCGYALSDEEVMDPINWPRIGYAGKTLMRLRDELRQGQAAASIPPSVQDNQENSGLFLQSLLNVNPPVSDSMDTK